MLVLFYVKDKQKRKGEKKTGFINNIKTLPKTVFEKAIHLFYFW
jgi:hypothetical protein